MKSVVHFVTKYKILLIISLLLVTVSIGTVFYFSNRKANKQNDSLLVVHFDTNGGNQIKDVKVESGNKIIKPDDPVKEGFLFLNWYYDNELFDFNTPITESITLSAMWSALEGTDIVTISLDSNGGSSFNNIQLKKGSKILLLPTPIRKGYKFLGWYLNNNIFDIEESINNNITLVANWEKDKSNLTTEEKKTLEIIEEINNNTENNNGSNNNQNQECYYYIDKHESSTYGIDVGYSGNLYNALLQGVSYTLDTCSLSYKSSNSNIASINKSGIVNAKSEGKATLSICISDKGSKKELGCYNVSVDVNDPNAPEKTTIPYEKLSGVWYKVGTNDVTFELKKDSTGTYNIRTSHISSSTLEEWRGAGDGGHGGGTLLQPYIDEYKMRLDDGYLYLTKGNNTVKFSRKASVIKVNDIKIIYDNNEINTIDLNVNDDISVIARIYPGNADNVKVTWSSSNTSVVKVTGSEHMNLITAYYKEYIGYIKAVGEGTATITVKSNDGGFVKNFVVKVTKVPVKGINFTSNTLDITRGKSEQIEYSINPSNATNKKVIWTSSDDNVASVDSNGKVTGKSKGTAIITAKTADGNYTATCTINVNNAKLHAEGKLYTSTFNSGGTKYTRIAPTIEVSGGTEHYTYYYIELYENDVLYNKSNNSWFQITGADLSGTYKINFVVRDSEGNEYSGSAGPFIVE